MAKKANDDSSLSHTRWNCKYHIVFMLKYRRKTKSRHWPNIETTL